MTDAELDEFLEGSKSDGMFSEWFADGLFERTVERIGENEQMYWSRYDFTTEQWEAMTWHEPLLAYAESGRDGGYIHCKYYNNEEDDSTPFVVSGYFSNRAIKPVRQEFDNAIDAMDYYWKTAKPVTDRMDVIRNHEGHGSLKDGAL